MAFLPLRFTVSAKRRWLAGALISLALSVLLFAQSAPPVKEATVMLNFRDCGRFYQRNSARKG
jgi:hypothetical protein